MNFAGFRASQSQRSETQAKPVSISWYSRKACHPESGATTTKQAKRIGVGSLRLVKLGGSRVSVVASSETRIWPSGGIEGLEGNMNDPSWDRLAIRGCMWYMLTALKFHH